MPPRKAPAKARKRGDGAIKIKLGDREYAFSLADLNALDDVAARRETGFPVMHHFDMLRTTPGLDNFAVIAWMARRHGGEPDVTFTECAEDISVYDLEGVGGADEEDDLPEA